ASGASRLRADARGDWRFSLSVSRRRDDVLRRTRRRRRRRRDCAARLLRRSVPDARALLRRAGGVERCRDAGARRPCRAATHGLMKCPYCGHLGDKVVDSRESKEGEVIRRRRECLECGKRFTSYERIEEIPYMVVKKDGRRERFDRQKLVAGLLKACEKRPVCVASLELPGDKGGVTLKDKPE